MSMSPDSTDPRRNLSALRWDAAWIDPALRRMAEAAAERAGLDVEAWMERAIRKRCGMPPVDHFAMQRAAPAANFATALSGAQRDAVRQPAEPQHRASPRAATRPEPHRRVDDEEPLALTDLVDRVPDRLPRRPPPPPPRPQPQPRGLSVFWAAGIAAVLAFIAVMVVRDPSLLRSQFLTADNQADRATAPETYADSDTASLRVSPARPTDNKTRIAILPPPPSDTKLPANGAAPVPAASRVAELPPSADALPSGIAATHPLATGVVADVPPPPSVTEPEPSQPPMQTAAAPPGVDVSPLPPPARTTPKPVQMAALPSSPPAPGTPVAAAKPQVPEPTPLVTPAAPVQPSSTAVAAAQAPAVAATAEPAAGDTTSQVAMAPAAAPAPAPPATPSAQQENAATAADAQMAADLETTVKAGDHVAEYRLGILYALGKGVARDYDRAAKLLRASAESGLPEAEYDYGVLCDKGLGVPRDAAEAARWYAKAAQKGHPPAALNLGYAYAEGLGVTRNLPEAARWFRRAAEAGLINAQFNLAYMYEQGAGVTKSPIDAYAWYSIAAEKGDQGAQQALDRIAVKMTPRELQTAKARVKTMKRSIRVQN